MNRVKIIAWTGILGLLAGCTAYRADTGLPDPRPLGSEYATYTPPGLSDESASIPDSHLFEEPEGPLFLSEAMAMALIGNPELATFSLEIRAAEARRLQAGLLPNPEVSYEVEEFSGDRSGFRESENTVVLSQLIPLGGKRAKRTSLAEMERDLAGWDYEAKRLDLLTEVTRDFAALLGAQRRVELTEEALTVAGEVAKAVSEKVRAGAASPVEAMRATVAAASAGIELEHARQALEAARKRLASAWGASEPHFTEARGVLEIDPELPQFSSLTDRLSQNPDLARWDLELDRRRAALELARAGAIPDVTVEAGYRWLTEEDFETFVAGLSLPLPLFDRNQGAIIEERTLLARAEREKEAAEVRTSIALANAFDALTAASKEVRTLEGEMLPAAQSVYESIREGYRHGKFDYLDLLSAQQSLSGTQMNYVDALVSLNQAKADVERLIGEPLP